MTSSQITLVPQIPSSLRSPEICRIIILDAFFICQARQEQGSLSRSWCFLCKGSQISSICGAMCTLPFWVWRRVLLRNKTYSLKRCSQKHEYVFFFNTGRFVAPGPGPSAFGDLNGTQGWGKNGVTFWQETSRNHVFSKLDTSGLRVQESRM